MQVYPHLRVCERVCGGLLCDCINRGSCSAVRLSECTSASRRSKQTALGSLTDALGPGGAGLKAVVAGALVAPHGVDTAAVLTDAGLGATLVQVCRRGRGREGGYVVAVRHVVTSLQGPSPAVSCEAIPPALKRRGG